MTHIQVLGPLRRSVSVRHIDGALVVNIEGDVRPLIGDYHAVVVRGRGLVDGQGGRTFDQWYTQVVGQMSQTSTQAPASAAMYSTSVLERATVVWREDDQWTGLPLTVTSTPETGALVSLQLA
jgi:hypothetical protein